jgi:hypothetical protein
VITIARRIADLNIRVCCECGRKIARGSETNVCGPCLERVLMDAKETEKLKDKSVLTR